MIFISYAREDRELIQQIMAYVGYALTMGVWTDSKIQFGTSYTHSIQRALDEAWIVIVAWSRKSINSDYVIDEAIRARDAGKLFPIKLEAVNPPLGFGGLQTFDLTDFPRAVRDNGDVHATLERLVNELTAYIPKHVDLPLLLRLNETESRELDIARCLSQERRIALICGLQESVAALPFYHGLGMLGFSTTLQPEPQEFNGAEMLPRMNEVSRADLSIFLLFPTAMSTYYFETCRGWANGMIGYLLFGSLSVELAKKMYLFLAAEPDYHFLSNRSLGLPLAGKGVEETWTTIRFIIERCGERSKQI